MKHVLVSGGTRGIGAAIVKRFLSGGYKVTALYSSDENSREKLASELNARDVSFYRVDVSDPDAVKALMEEIGHVDCLVSNAGISVTGLADTFGFDVYRKVMDINFGGFFNLCHEVVPPMISAKSGSIIAVSSMWGQVGASCEALYSASKGAVDSYVRSLAKELGPSGIRVNAVSPGVIKTPMLDCYTAEDLDALAEETPLGKLGTPEEVADLVFYLASEQSSFITGQIIGVNGGFI